MARAAAEGHRVVLIVATNGEHGEVPDDLADGETLADRRRVETEASAAILGVDRIVWLGYQDSGMTGWDGNDDSASFHQADLDEAGERVAAVLRDERADVFTIYDWHGTYGHPDHVKVHRVGRRAAELVDHPMRTLEATANRDAMAAMISAAKESGVEMGSPDADADDEFDPTSPADDGNPFGEPESVLTLRVDVSERTDGEACLDALSPQPDHRLVVLPRDARRGLHDGVRRRVVHRTRSPATAPRRVDLRVGRRPLIGRTRPILDHLKIAVTSVGCPRPGERFRAR